MKKRKTYTSAEIAEILGISKQTLVRYEKKKFFPKPKRNPINKWRTYTETDLEKMLKIMEFEQKQKTYKRMGGDFNEEFDRGLYHSSRVNFGYRSSIKTGANTISSKVRFWSS